MSADDSNSNSKVLSLGRLPIAMPLNWVTEDWFKATAITAVAQDGRRLGTVTVCERVRHFAPGFSTVHALSTKPVYSGAGWRTRLYHDAVRSLQEIYKDELDVTPSDVSPTSE